MPRLWNTGIYFMTLLINGLLSGPRTISPNMGVSTTAAQKPSCPVGTVQPDINECNEGKYNCDAHSTCENTQGGYYCKCDPGYQKGNQTEFYSSKDKENRCTDINECHEGRYTCDAHSNCENTEGGYFCKCDPGYQKGNQTAFCPSTDKKKNRCTDIDECKNDSYNCDAHSYCKNTQGGYDCKCDPGYQRENQKELSPSKDKENSCTDIDECSQSPEICGSNATCNNTAGSYTCHCKEGFKNISNTCIIKCKYRKNKCQDNSFRCKLQNLVNNFTPACDNVTRQDNFSMEQLLEGLDDLIDGLRRLNKTERLQEVGHFLQMLEQTVQNLALLQQNPVSHENTQKTIRVQVSRGTPASGILSLQGKSSQVRMDSKTAAGHTGVALLGGLEYTNITDIVKDADFLEEKSKNTSFTVVSPVVSVFLGISNTSSLQQPVSIRLNFIEKVSFNNMSCVYWSVPDNGWSSEGCVMEKRDAAGVICSCTHLSSFAVLMLLQDYESWTLELITQIGLSISIFCLVLAIITFAFCRTLRGTRNTIHLHLCISLFIGNCIFLLGITAVDNRVLCGIIAGLLHGFYLCSFCWMSLEGLELYLMLVSVFNTHLKKRYLMAVGYGTPALIITISAAIYHQGYGTKKYCWLSRDSGFIWAFMGPVCAIVLVNCGIFVLTVWKLTEKMSSVSPEQGKLKRIRTLTMTSLAQLCILGSCWAFGFFMFSSATSFFAYAFTILNTLQGLQIFCLHCLMHKKVRAEYKRWLCALAHFKSPVYSEFSNTSNTHTHTKGKTGKESGL